MYGTVPPEIQFWGFEIWVYGTDPKSRSSRAPLHFFFLPNLRKQQRYVQNLGLEQKKCRDFLGPEFLVKNLIGENKFNELVQFYEESGQAEVGMENFLKGQKLSGRVLLDV